MTGDRAVRHLLVALALAAAAACTGGGDDNAAAPPVDVDTTNNNALDGLSAEQIQSQATPMTPEEAAAQGIVDTTIHLENLGSQDSTPAGAANNDTTVPRNSPDTARTDSAGVR
ncbi:MAG TPA: hypothetical protein VHG91_15815 [Longimicrobium sp.]|nr:hypothetical protein [Longimicrobium sp.]